jgi:hypothetical protein
MQCGENGEASEKYIHLICGKEDIIPVLMTVLIMDFKFKKSEEVYT